MNPRRALPYAAQARRAADPGAARLWAAAAAHFARCAGLIQSAGGRAKARGMSKLERSEAGRKAARVRWDRTAEMRAVYKSHPDPSKLETPERAMRLPKKPL